MYRTTFPVAVHLFLRNESQIFMLRRFQTGYEDGNYSVIAGHLEQGEDVFSAIIRETLEETGIRLNRQDLSLVQVMQRNYLGRSRIDYFFDCFAYTDRPFNAEPEKCDDARWVEIDTLPDNTVDYIRYALSQYQQHNTFTLFGW